MPPIDLTATTLKNPATTPKREAQFKSPPLAAARWQPKLFPQAPLPTEMVAFRPARQEEQGGEDPTGSTSSTDPSTVWSTLDPRAESGDDSSSSSPDSDTDHGAKARPEVKGEQERTSFAAKPKGVRGDLDAESWVPVDQAAALNFRGLGTRARIGIGARGHMPPRGWDL